MSIYDSFETDEQLEKDGAWIEIGDMSFKLRYAGAGTTNKQFTKAFDAVSRPYRRGQNGTVQIPENKATEIFYELYAKHVVVDWKGVVGKDQEEVPYSIENCVKIFRDLPKFFLTIKGMAEEIEHFKGEQLEAESGNL